jgi:hypothetical protein
MNGTVPACHRITEIPDLSPLYQEELSNATQTMFYAAKALGIRTNLELKILFMGRYKVQTNSKGAKNL